ncbi:MAG: ABC transporter permease [Aerococcus sp.]|nr:ABC transporter permease [Aerococcus sp.]
MRDFFKDFFQSKLNIIAMIFLVLVVGASLIAPLLPIDPNQTNVNALSQAPSAMHLFGTDEVGRDYFMRVLYGGRVSLLVGVLAMLASTLIGLVVGLSAAYFGGIVDTILMRLVDVLSSIPWLILVIVLNVFLTPGLTTVVIVIGAFSWMDTARMIRGQAMSVKTNDYVTYARFIKESVSTIIWRHIFPAIVPLLIVAATNNLAAAIMTESALSFLGLGIQKPMASWGSLLQDAQRHLQSSPYMAILPGLFIMLTIFAFNRIGNSIQQRIGKEV